MNPLIALIVIGMLVGVGWFGISSMIYNSDGTVKIPFLSPVPKFPIDFSHNNSVPTNSTENITEEYDWNNLMANSPIQQIISDLGHITSLVVEYISSPMQWLLEFLVHLASPTTVLPSFFGMITTLLIIIVFFILSYETIMHVVGKIAIVALIIICVIMTIVIVLSIFVPGVFI